MFPVVYRQIEQVDGELVEYDKEQFAQINKMRRQEVGKARTPQEKIFIERDRGYKFGWAYRQAVMKGMVDRHMNIRDFYRRYGSDSK